jgi:hypothetical protein
LFFSSAIFSLLEEAKHNFSARTIGRFARRGQAFDLSDIKNYLVRIVPPAAPEHRFATGHLQSNPISDFNIQKFSFFFVLFPALKPSCGIRARG